MWAKIGSDIRNTHEVIDVTTLLGGQSNVSVRVRTFNPDLIGGGSLITFQFMVNI